MWIGRRRAQDQLSDFWNALVRNAPPNELALASEHTDPANRAAIERAHALHVRQRPDPAFANQLETDLMNAFAKTTAGAIPLPVTVPYPNGRSVPERSPWLPEIGLGRKRLRWALASLAAALLIVIAGIGGYFTFFDERSNQPAVLLQESPEASPGPGWTTFRGNAARSGEGNAGPVGQPIELWRFQAGGPCEPSPAVVSGVVYAACNDANLYALDAVSGEERWRFAAAGPIENGLVIAEDNAYVIDNAGTLYAIDLESGQDVWRFGEVVLSQPAVENGLLVTSTLEGDLVGIDAATGAERWRFNVSSQNGLPAPALSDGIAYAGSPEGEMVAVDAETGELIWRQDTGEGPNGTAVIADGIAYISTAFNPPLDSLHAFDAATGELLWQSDVPIHTPAVSDGVGYAGSAAGILYSFDASTGEERWHVDVEGPIRPVAVAGNVLYLPNDGDQTIYAFDTETGAELWQFGLDGGINQSIAVSDGVLYATTMNGSVYAIGGTGAAIIPAPQQEASPEASPAASAILPDPPVEPVWTTAGGPVTFETFYVAVAPDGKVWANDIGQGGFQIFDADGNHLETWFPESPPSSGEVAKLVAFDQDGNIYVLDQFQVRKFDSDRNLLATWGSVGTGDGQFQGAGGIGVDRDGNVYVCDGFRNDVQKFDSDGNFLTKWGSQGSEDGQFQSCGFMDVDLDGNSYVPELGNGRVQKFDAEGNHLLTFGTGLLSAPNDVAIDAQGNIYVGEYQSGVQIFDASGNHLGSWESLDADVGSFSSADAVALDGNGGVYVADNLGSQVVKFQLLPPLGPEE